MIHIALGSSNTIYATVKEKRKYAAGYTYLLSFKHDVTGTVVSFKVDTVLEDDRITSFRFTEGTGAGEHSFKLGGFWHYTIYEDLEVLNTDPAAPSIVKVLETGKAQISGGDAVSYTQHSPSTNNSVYIKV